MEGKKYGKHLRLYLIWTIDNPNITRQPKHKKPPSSSSSLPSSIIILTILLIWITFVERWQLTSPSVGSEAKMSKWPKQAPTWRWWDQRWRKTIRNCQNLFVFVKTYSACRWPSPLFTTRSSYPVQWGMIAAWSSPPLHFLFSSTRWKRDFGVSFIIIIIIFTRFRLSNKLQYDGRRPLDSSLQPLVSLS